MEKGTKNDFLVFEFGRSSLVFPWGCNFGGVLRHGGCNLRFGRITMRVPSPGQLQGEVRAVTVELERGLRAAHVQQHALLRDRN